MIEEKIGAAMGKGDLSAMGIDSKGTISDEARARLKDDLKTLSSKLIPEGPVDTEITPQYMDFVNKYKIEVDGEMKETIEKLNTLREELSGMAKSKDKVKKQEEFNKLHIAFIQELRIKAEVELGK